MTTGQSPKKRATVALVTPWHNHLELAPDYFQTVELAKPDQLVVVDDGSTPALEFAATRLDIPKGFCTASNAGLALVETDIVVMLNNDIAPLKPDWLEPIRRMVEPGVVVGPFRFDRHGDVDGVNYPYVDGWCMALMTEDARRIGGWDETYDLAGPAYFSDNAFSFQARMQGMKLREHRPGIRHKGGQTGGRGPQFHLALQANKPLWEQQVREALK